jgi:hypothetical protein
MSHIFVNVRLWPHLDTCIWGPSYWSRRLLRVSVWGPSGTLVRPWGSLETDLGQKGSIKVRPMCVGCREVPCPRAIYLSRHYIKDEGSIHYETTSAGNEECNPVSGLNTHTHTHTHIYIYIYNPLSVKFTD